MRRARGARTAAPRARANAAHAQDTVGPTRSLAKAHQVHGARPASAAVAGTRGAWSLLIASELRRRRDTYALLVGVFLLATTALGLIVGSVNGVLAGVGVEIRDTLSSDARLVRGDATNLGGGRFVDNADAQASELRALSGAAVAPRIEVQGVLLHEGAAYEEFDSGLLIGVDPARDALVADVPSRLVAGRWIDAESVWIGGAPYAQLVVGADMLRAHGMTVFDGSLRASDLLNVTAGRFDADSGALRPVTKTGIVVGVFETGFNPIDRRTVYLHIGAARELLRAQFEPAAANVLLAKGGDPQALAQAARADGFETASHERFREHYLGAVLAPLRAFTALVTLVVLALAGGWVAHVVAGAVLGDRRRIAVLRALGVPARLVVGPIAVLLLACAAVGVALGLAVALATSGALGLVDLRIPGVGPSLRVALTAAAAATIAAGVLATALAAAGGAGAALRRVAPSEALRE